jgi:hypothetical protein
MNHQDRITDLPGRIASLDWDRIARDLDSTGYALVPKLLDQVECERLAVGYDSPGAFRKTVVMARYRFGLGEYKYWTYPLPEIVQTLRQGLYSHLAPIVNGWLRKLGITPDLPEQFDQMRALCHGKGQTLPTPLILRYGKGGFNTLHRDLYGEVYFPVQAVINLSEPGVDFEGGEFVLTEQVPRAQSKAMVLSPRRGDMIIFTTNFRPVKGSRGYYRASVRHGVSEVRSGSRTAVGIIFHEATS